MYASSRDDFVHKGLVGNAATCNGPSFKTYKFWNGCDIVGFWWSLNSPAGAKAPFQLVGIDILEVNVASGKVKADYSEFLY